MSDVTTTAGVGFFTILYCRGLRACPSLLYDDFGDFIITFISFSSHTSVTEARGGM